MWTKKLKQFPSSKILQAATNKLKANKQFKKSSPANQHINKTNLATKINFPANNRHHNVTYQSAKATEQVLKSTCYKQLGGWGEKMAGGDGDGSPFQYGRVEDGMVEPDSLRTVADCTAEVERSVTNWEALCQVG